MSSQTFAIQKTFFIFFRILENNHGGNKIKNKFLRVFICLLAIFLGIGPAAAMFHSNTPMGPDYSDYYVNNGRGDVNNATVLGGVVTDSATSSIEYDIFKDVWAGNVTYTTKWKRNIDVTWTTVAIQKYSVLAQDSRSMELHVINKYTGNDRWTIKLSEQYDRIQFIGSKYAVLMNQYGFLQLNLYTQHLVTGKIYDEGVDMFYGLVKSKKNGNYYVMTLTGETWRFFKLKNT